jgi:hypothetical protein
LLPVAGSAAVIGVAGLLIFTKQRRLLATFAYANEQTPQVSR